MNYLVDMVKFLQESDFHNRVQITETDHINIINKDYIVYSTHLKNYKGYEITSVQKFKAENEVAEKYSVELRFKDMRNASSVVFRNSESANKFLKELQSRYNIIMNKEVVEIVE
jgi:hypothetical protein